MISEQFGVVFYILPLLLVTTCGNSGWIGILIGTAVALIVSQRRNNLAPFSFPCFWGLFAAISGWSLWEATRVAWKFLVPGESFWLTLVLGALVILLGIFTRQQGVRNVINLMTIFILIPFVLVLLANAPGVKLSELCNTTSYSARTIAYGSLLTFCSMMFATMCPENSKNSVGKRCITICISGGLLLAEYLILIGNFGTSLLKNLKDPVMVLAGGGSGAWGMNMRLEVLMAGTVYLWFMLLSVSLSSALEHKGGKPIGVPGKIILAAAIFCVAAICERNSYWIAARRDRLLIGFIVIWGIFMVVRLLGRKSISACLLLCLLLMSTCTMSGCATEIEDKLFLNTVIVTPDDIYLISPKVGESTGEQKAEETDDGAIVIPASQWKGIENVTGVYTDKTLEISHLEVLIVDKSLMESDSFRQQLYRDVEEETDISWNTLIFTTTMAKPQKLNGLSVIHGNLGEYLSNLMEQSETDPVILTDFMKAQQQKQTLSQIPQVWIQNKIPKIMIE